MCVSVCLSVTYVCVCHVCVCLSRMCVHVVCTCVCVICVPIVLAIRSKLTLAISKAADSQCLLIPSVPDVHISWSQTMVVST